MKKSKGSMKAFRGGVTAGMTKTGQPKFHKPSERTVNKGKKMGKC